MKPLIVLGAPGSPYTMKMLALLRFRRIGHHTTWIDPATPNEDLPPPRVPLLPTIYFTEEDGTQVPETDSTPIIQRLEGIKPNRTVMPADPAMAFFCALIEDYADEWLTKPMFHYRWSYQPDIENAGDLIAAWAAPSVPDDQMSGAASTFAARQVGRLGVVGSSAQTGPVIEASYERFLTVFNAIILERPFLFGARPSAADFAIFGQLTQLVSVDPTPSRVAERVSRRIRAWVDRVADLSGLPAQGGGWSDAEDALPLLRPLFAEIARTYSPVMAANAAAVQAGEANFTTIVDGAEWTQPVFPYQAKCVAALRAHLDGLDLEQASAVRQEIAAAGLTACFD